ncbi:MAG: excisionase family DNA-binding protein [Phycisphaerae bacterium]|nr:excisionase family DNA-binding protein [Phycisphaerae bacterium]
MAKMFYTVEEAAQKLGLSEPDIQKMVEDGKLQQFRDRDQVMFKREQVDEMFSLSQTQQVGAPGADDTARITADGTDRIEADGTDEIRGDGTDRIRAEETDRIKPDGTDRIKPDATDRISVADSIADQAAQTAAIDLMAETTKVAPTESPKSATATGISVFDADEIGSVDPMAQTQVTSSFAGDDDELTLESVGSGSGLLDLTREADDTSLGAVELLEDLGSGEGSDVAMSGSSTGLFDAAGGVESAPELAELEAAGASSAAAYMVEETDPPGDGFGGGMLMGVFGVLAVALIITVTGMRGLVVKLTDFFAESPDKLMMWAIVALALPCVVFCIIGWMMGKSRVRKEMLGG